MAQLRNPKTSIWKWITYFTTEICNHTMGITFQIVSIWWFLNLLKLLFCPYHWLDFYYKHQLTVIHFCQQSVLFNPVLRLSHHCPASCLTQIVTQPGWKTPYTKFGDSRSPLKNLFSPWIIGSLTVMSSSLTLRLAHSTIFMIKSSLNMRYSKHTFIRKNCSKQNQENI